jgi:hypothetical protein
MTGLVRKATLLAVLGLVVTSAVALAGVPSPANCVRPAYIDLVGCNPAPTQDPYGTFSVLVRDLANNPISGCPVVVTFNNDVRIYTVIPGLIVAGPAPRTVTAISDLSGYAWFSVSGAGQNTNGSNTTNTGANAATFSVCGYPLSGTAHVCTFDENGVLTTKGVEITDLAAWGADYNARLVPGRPMMYRSDFNHGGTLEIVDLATWGKVKNAGKSNVSCGTLF